MISIVQKLTFLGQIWAKMTKNAIFSYKNHQKYCFRVGFMKHIVYFLKLQKLQNEVAQLQFFYIFFKLLHLFSNIYVEVYKGIKSRCYFFIWISIPRIPNFCTRKRTQLLRLQDIYHTVQFTHYDLCTKFVVFCIQISFSHNYFSIWSIYMIFTGNRGALRRFLTATKKSVKKVKKMVKFEIFEKSQNFEKIIHFFKSLTFVYSFYLLCTFLLQITELHIFSLLHLLKTLKGKLWIFSKIWKIYFFSF